jgi:hypothetical protein
MDEGRKRVLLIAASILAARKLAQLDSTKPCPAQITAIHDSIILCRADSEEDRRAVSRPPELTAAPAPVRLKAWNTVS